MRVFVFVFIIVSRSLSSALMSEKTKFSMVTEHSCHPPQRVEKSGVGKDGVEVEALRTY